MVYLTFMITNGKMNRNLVMVGAVSSGVCPLAIVCANHSLYATGRNVISPAVRSFGFYLLAWRSLMFIFLYNSGPGSGGYVSCIVAYHTSAPRRVGWGICILWTYTVPSQVFTSYTPPPKFVQDCARYKRHDGLVWTFDLKVFHTCFHEYVMKGAFEVQPCQSSATGGKSGWAVRVRVRIPVRLCPGGAHFISF